MNPSMSLLTVYVLVLQLFIVDSLQQARKKDIVFLIDGSPGMGRSFLQVRSFLNKVIQELDIGPDKDQVAVVQYSSDSRLEFGLNTHSTKNEVLNALRTLRLKTGRPLNTGAALDFVTRNVFTPSAGSRSDAGASQILVLITAGKSRDSVGRAANAVKQAGIVPFAIGAKSADTSELRQIVLNPDSVLKLGDFQELQTTQRELLSKVRAVSVIEEPIPPTEVTSDVQDKRDIVFLIDESDYVGSSNLPLVRDFITRIVENLDIGSDRVRVGLVLYSDIVETEFYLNTYSRKDDLLSLLRSLRFKGGTTLNTGKALDFVLRYHFTRSAGSRGEEGVPQLLVLITGGRSGDDITASADALKRAAVITFTVGARNADPAQLKEMAFEPRLAFNVRDFYSLSNLQEQIMTSLQKLHVQSVPFEGATIPIDGPLVTNIKVPASRKRDIVFLIDGSPGMGRSFLQVRNFVNKVIQELDIGPDKDQVAVVQYSSDSTLEFGLNTHSTKDEVLNALRKLRLKTGRPLNTGAALDFVTRNVFTPSAGSRSDAGASQILVLITAGQSRDDVGRAAHAVKQAGIVPIAIGAKSADTSELRQIVLNPDSVLKLEDFQDMQTIHQELLSKVRAVSVIEESIPPTEVLPMEMSERDIVFLIDGSDNVGDANLPFVRDFMTRIIQNLAIGSDEVRVGLAQYSDDTEAEFYLNTYSSKAELLSHIRSLRLIGGTTANTGSALDFAIKYYFTRSAGSRIKENVPQFLVLVTGGRSSDDVEAPADALKRAAVMTFAVGVKHTDPAQLEEIAIDPSLIFNVKEFHSLSDVHNQLIIPLTTLTVPTVIIEEPTIKPEEEPIAPTEVSASIKRDIVFLIDGSPGMGRSFLQVRNFVNNVIQEFDIGPDKDQVAVVQYSSNPRLEFGLNTHSTKDEVLNALRKLRLKTGRPLNTGAALDFVTRNVFTPSAGSRSESGASQILVLITAGKSRDDVGRAADAVKQSGIVPIAIGAKSADTSELRQIVLNPDSVLKLEDFQDMQTIHQELVSKVRAVSVIEEPIPPTEVLPMEMSERDIVFLIDGSDNVGDANLPFVRDFMTRIIQNLAIGSDEVRVGLAQYSDDTEAEFYLNTYSSEADLLSHIRSLRLIGGTRANTGSALDFAIKYYFTRSGGSRIKENVPQFLVLVTGGRSSDDVEAPADALKRAAVMTFAVGVKHTDPAQLEEIAIDPSLMFSVKEFHSLSDVHNQLIIPLTTLTVPTVIIEEPTIKPEVEPVAPTEVSAVRKRDIVFLIDGSPGMGKSFLQIRNFVNKVIQELDIGPDKDQVAVVQYSSDTTLEFGLNTHSTKDEVLNALRKLRLKTGRPLNTGAALDFVTRNVFTPSAGSRSDAGASQILVLITAGKSRDDVGRAADAVKQAGIVPIAIGAKSADTSELRQIVLHPDSVLKLEDFQDMQTIHQELLSKVRAVSVIEEPIPPTEVLPMEMSERDIVFLIDGSDNVGDANLPFVRDFMTRIIQNLAIGSDEVRVGLAQYSDDTEAEFYLNTYSSEADLLSHIRSLRLIGGTTANTGSALDFAIKYYFTSSAGSRIKENVPQFLVLVTGGRSSDDVEAPADALKRAAVMTFAVGVKHTDPAQLEEIAIDPSLMFSVKEFHSLSDVHNQLIIPLTTLTVPTVIIEEPTIKPEEEPVAPTEATSERKRDIVILIDGSPGMGKSFLQVRNFLIKVIQEFDIGPDKDQVAVVQYSSNPRLEFGLNTHSTKDEVLNALRKLRLKTGRPLNTGAALDFVTRNVFTPSAGSRSDAGASQILVLITAGKSRDDVARAADAVKQAGIVPIAIGAKSADTSELRQIVLHPDSVLKLGDFQELQTIHQELLSKVRAVSVIEAPIPPTEVLPMEMSERDIVFLIDGSDNVGDANLPFVRDFMTRIIQNLAIGSDEVRVGLAQYSDDTEAEFYLNTYSSKAELLSHIRSLRLIGGTRANTGSALDFAIKYYFTRSAGSRIKENVPQFLVLVTGGRSSDDVEAPADALKRAAVMTFAVGVKHTDPAQLEEIAIDPSLMFSVKEFHSLSDVHNQLIIPLTTLTVPTVIIEEPTIKPEEEPVAPTEDIQVIIPLTTLTVPTIITEEPTIKPEEEPVAPTEAMKRDIVFLIDGSSGMGRSFLQVRELLKVIQELDIGPDKDQVAVVQYSSDSRLEFGLNTHSTKAEVLNALRKLRLKTGRPLNTGAALDFVTRNVFTPSAGSRSDAGASQILVLITAGKSRDDVGRAADAVKQAGIVPIAIGAKSADTSELRQIVLNPDSVLKLGDFKDLQTIQRELLSKVRAVSVIEEPIPPIEVAPEEVNKRDIVLLIDGSVYVGNVNFIHIRQFITRLIETLDIGSDRVRVAVAQYSDDVKTESYLNSYSTKAELLSHVRGLQVKGGRLINTGAALGYVLKNHFTKSAGSRKEEGVPQILMLLTGGRSRDDIKSSADALKRAAVMTFSIGVKRADPAQLEEISSDPSSVFNVKEFRSLSDIQNQVLTPLLTSVMIPLPTTIVPPVTTAKALTKRVSKKDIVFLIDGSDNVGNTDFSFVRDFLTSIIENLDIGSDRVRIGLVRYSNYAETEFYLNTYSSEDEILSHVEGLRLRGGRPLNTGAALDYVLRTHFTRPSGSRKEEGVHQILVLVAAGRSRDNVKPSADALKQAAVTIFAVGAWNADQGQLREIASDPSLSLNVQEFHSLPNVQEQVMMSISTPPAPRESTNAPTVPINPAQKASKRDIVFLIDGSDNVGNTDFSFVRDFLTSIIENLDIGSDRVRIGLVQYSNYAETEFYLNTYSSEDEILPHVEGLRLRGGRPLNTGAALDYVLRTHFTRPSGSRKEEGVHQILVLVAAGRSRDNVKPSADALKQAAVTIFAVGAWNADQGQLREIASDPSLSLNVQEFHSLPNVQEQVMMSISTPPAPRESTNAPTVPINPAQKASKRDIVFLIDGSDNVGNTDFSFVRDFLTSIIENLDIGSDRVRIGLVQYSNYAETEFYLNTYSSEDEILPHVEGLRLRGGRPLNTGAALDYVLRTHFTRPSGSRKEEGVHQILVLVAAGRSRDNVKPSADALKQAAVTIFAVGAWNADQGQLREIASDPSLSLNVQEFHSLPNVQEQVMMSISTPPAPRESTNAPTVPINPAQKASKRDIVFLIDGSDNVGNTDFSFVRDFLTSIIENLDIGSDRVRIGLVQYSNYAETEFYLNTYSSEDEILPHVEGLRLRGGRPLNTGAALDYVLRNHFTRPSGSRKEEGVHQILVLVTAGRSRDYVKPSADALKQAAVTIFAIGARNADQGQLREIASDPSLSLNVQEFHSLPHVQEQVMMSISTSPAPPELTNAPTVPINPVVADGGSKRDIVFLIDGSDNVGSRNLPFVRDFLTSIIENFDIGSDRVQVGLIQYSNYAETEFYLNTYSSEDEIRSHVEGLRLRGGTSLNTGAALDYVLQNHFTISSGSRKEEGIPQLLVLITAGRSSDDIKPSADALKQAAVIIFAIGARNANPAQLKEIAVDPSLVFSLQEFHSLPHIQEQLMTPLSTLAASRVPAERPTVPIKQVVREVVSKRDIVFLIDGSDRVGNTNFALVCDFLASIIQGLDIGTDRVQVGLVQYSTYADTEFYLNTYLSKAEILSHVRRLRLKGGPRLNTGAAMDYVYRYHFISSAGSRKRDGVAQFLVLLTGGRSSDEASPAARALKRAAIMSFAVGVKNANIAELKEIAIDPSLVFSANEYYSLPNIQEEMTTLLSTLPAPRVIPEGPTAPIKQVAPDDGGKRDIVFLVDGSDNVGNRNLPFVRDFLTRMIENLDIGRDRVQVGLVQYSNYAETEFYLNTYSSEEEILSHVEGLRLRGGTSLNTGAALDSVLRYHVTKSAGSRKEDGVPQILVLITSGRSRDDVRLPANALKQAATMTFVIGSMNADSVQMKEIAMDPGLVFNVQEFNLLPDIQEQVMTSLSTLAAPAVTHGKPTVNAERPTNTITVVTSDAQDKRDIVFLIDESDYVGSSNLPLVRDFITRIIENLDIGSDRVRVGLVLYSNIAETEFYLNTYSRKDDLLSLLRSLRFKGGTTLNTGKALDFVLRYHFTRSAGSRGEEGVPQLLVLITGGRSGDDITASADALKRAAVITFTVGARNADPAQLKEMAFEPRLAFNVRDFYSLSDTLEKVMTPLQRQRVPNVIIDEPEVLTGEPTVTSTEVSAVRKRDIVFLIDGSPGMGKSFLQIRNFLNKVIQELDIGPNKDQVAVVQYSSDSRLEFGLNTHSTKEEVLNALKKLRLKTGRPLNTGAALDFVRRNVFTPSAGSRSDAGASQILVLITAGQSRDDVGRAADAVKQAGIVPIAIGAKRADTSELRQIVLNPDSVLKLGDFQDLQTIQQDLLSKVRAVFTIEKSLVTTEVLPMEMSERDIVFLIDGSDNVGDANLPFVRDFMTRIIQNLAIGSDKVRVGLAQYSDDTEAEFYLNTYSSEADLLSHIRSLRLIGGTTANTGSALDFAIKYYFSSSGGSRINENVPQFLVLVTGGRSSDDVEAPADALKRAAVMTFAVGVKHTDPAQLEEIAIDPSLIFNVKEFHSLPDVHNQLIIPLTTLTVPTVIIEEPVLNIEEEVVTITEARKRDIVFLIDGSPGMGRSFPLAREFLKNVIQELDIGPDKDQVAVVQYSSDSRLEFRLNTHSTKDEILSALPKMRLKTGRPLNTGAALDFVRRNVFTPSAGSRSDAGASQILVLITAGKSRDDVGRAADAVKQAGIVPIAIGAKSADTSELLQIVYESNFIFKLRDFRELPSIQKELISKVKTVFIVEEITAVNTEVLPEVSKRDIVFLIDGSDNVGNTNLILVHDFIRNIIENLNIGSDHVRVGLAQFSYNAKTEFYLNTYTSKAEILRRVKGLKLKGGTILNTGAALDFVFQNHFTSQAGSRKDQGVPQFLVLFTGGKSLDAVKPQADALKRAAIATFAVGVRNADLAQLQEIATDPNLVFSVKEFNNLPNVQERVMTPLSTLSVPTAGESTRIAGEPPVTNEKASLARQRDIVFLIDGTLGMGKAFPLVRAFLMRVIQELDIGPDKDQIAVVQYSHDPKTEFELNTYTSKDEVLAATTQLRRKTGRVLNTGAALNYVTKNVFITSAGSRRDTGATQILVLITAGKSRDDVGQAAFAVKRAGIVPIAIGAKSAHSAELHQIVYSPDFVFVLQTFHNVPTIQQRLISILKQVSVESLEGQPQ
ncbi:uncharacterized protein col6a3 isoform X2 [Scyliorhinus canicula]|uniref:uncharacterized protein col6a3 isoform X2 n=1 Tax=Scyliorhinus canicula TaxID=7830 RepID=UPI0018F6108D|nr:uncharacterized protein col6a3 isoform X2 [Scyliorhinus canicula]